MRLSCQVPASRPGATLAVALGLALAAAGWAQTAADPRPVPADGGVVTGAIDTVAELPERLAPFDIGVDPVPTFLRRPGHPGATLKLGLGIRVPFFRRGRVPIDEMDFKFGPLYLDLSEFSASVLYTSNAWHSDANPEEAWLASTSLGLGLYLPLTDNAYFRVRGGVVWLPFEGEIGLDGGDLRDIYSLGWYTLLQGELYYDFRMGGWDVILQDQFSIDDIRLQNETQGLADVYTGPDFTATDAAGYYDFGNDRPQHRDLVSEADLGDNNGTAISNTVSGTLTRPVPGQARVTLTAFHRRHWFPGDSVRQGGWPAWEEGFNGSWVSENEQWRFLPYVTGSHTHNDRDRGWTDIGRAGFQGDVNPELNVLADVGVGRAGEDGIDTTVLWRCGIRHILGPLSRQEFTAARQISAYEQAVTTFGRYTFDQILGANWRGRLFADEWRYDYPAEFGPVNSRLRRYGGTLMAQLGERATLAQTVLYHDETWDDGRYRDLWRFITAASLLTSRTSYLYLTYEYRDQQAADVGEGDFREHLATLTWVKAL